MFRAQRQRCPEIQFNARLVDAETGNHLSTFLDHALGCSSERWEAHGTKRRLTERTLASTHCFSLSVMMPASRRQLALKDMKEAEGASLIGKISSRFTGDFMALSALIGPFFSLGTD